MAARGSNKMIGLARYDNFERAKSHREVLEEAGFSPVLADSHTAEGPGFELQVRFVEAEEAAELLDEILENDPEDLTLEVGGL